MAKIFLPREPRVPVEILEFFAFRIPTSIYSVLSVELLFDHGQNALRMYATIGSTSSSGILGSGKPRFSLMNSKKC